MIQGYFLSLFYLIFSSLIYFQGKYRIELSFMLRFTDELEKDRKKLYGFSLLGLLTFLILLFFPQNPGPVILGDLIPSLVVLYNTIYFFMMIKRKEKSGRSDYLDTKRGERKIILGYISFSVAVLHFLLPSFVLI